MTRSPGYCGVILAEGSPERISRCLLPWPPGNPLGSTLLSVEIEALNAVSELVLVLAGSNGNAITNTLYARGAYLVNTGEGTCTDFESLKIGVRELLNRGRDTAIVVPVDMVPFSAAGYRLLCEAYQASERNVWAVVPKSTEPATYPLIAGREFIEQILRAPAGSDLTEVLRVMAAHVLAVDVDEHASSSTLAQQTS